MCRRSTGKNTTDVYVKHTEVADLLIHQRHRYCRVILEKLVVTTIVAIAVIHA